MHHHEQPPGAIQRDALAVPDPGRVAFGRRKGLPQRVGVVFPQPRAGLRFLAGVRPRHARDPISRLAGIGRAAHVDEQLPLRIDHEGMHRVIAAQRQAGHHHLGLAGRHDAVLGQGISDDLVVLLGVDIPLVQADASAALGAVRSGVTEPGNLVGLAGLCGVLERDEEAVGLGLRIRPAGPAVDIDHAIGGHRQMTDRSEVIGEHGGAESRRQGDSAIVAGTRGLGGRRAGVGRIGAGQQSAAAQQSPGRQGRRDHRTHLTLPYCVPQGLSRPAARGKPRDAVRGRAPSQQSRGPAASAGPGGCLRRETAVSVRCGDSLFAHTRP